MRRLCRFLIPCGAAAVVAAAPAGAASFHAMPIVDAGRVAAGAGMAHAFLYEAGAMTGLNDPDVLYGLIDPAAGWEMTDADGAAIDDVRASADAACEAGACHAARPDSVPAVPEPSVLALLGAGLALLGWRRPQAWGFTRLAPRCPG